MPLYDYRCHSCGKVFEVRQKFADEVLKTHEDCGGELERLISAPALQFKGTGWYPPDYGKGGKLPVKNAGPKSDRQTGGRADNKPHAKSATNTATQTWDKPAPA